MVFSSILFIFVFLPFVLVFYYLSKDKFKNVILLISSLVFYTVGEHKAIVLMITSILINYLLALLIEWKREKDYSRLFLICDIVINLGILFFYKYLDYSITIYNHITNQDIAVLNTVMPIGISFFTFQAMSYVIDVYRNDVEAEKNILDVGLYVSFFPQLVAGPIVRYNTISEQIKKRKMNLELFGEGAYRFMLGFSKKIILANNLALVANSSFDYYDFSKLPVTLAWVGSIAFSLQIFFDFSGYSDMAIGLGKMFGFEFQENFNYPYMAQTITDFWRRWHISLSQWFRDYVYFPLGGARVEISRHILNLFIVWMLTGLWHGANITFVIWGLVYFLMLVQEKYIIKPNKRKFAFRFIYRIVTLLIVNFGWILFNMESFGHSAQYIKAMFGLYGNKTIDTYSIGTIREYSFFLIMSIILSTPIIPKMLDAAERSKYRKIAIVVVTTVCVFIFVWAISFLVLGAHNPFIYFNF